MTAVAVRKTQFGKAAFSPIKRARYLKSKDAFEVQFEDGEMVVEPHMAIRKANNISAQAKFDRLEVEDWTKSGFVGYYDNGQTAEVSWSFLRELPSTEEDSVPRIIAYSADRPIASKREDRLGRSEFASGLARDLQLWNGRDSLVVALYGEWGCGKTSIKNLVLEANDSVTDEALPVMQFNPWQVSRIGSIPASFFRELDISLQTTVRSPQVEKTAARLSVYASTLTLSGTAIESVGKVLPWIGVPAGPVVETVGRGIKAVGTVAKSGSDAAKAQKEAAAKTIEGQKRAISEALLKLPRALLVVIDDIDRLTTEEILQVFQLVKANADFPRLVYLLLFDRKIVSKALNELSGGKGNEFLEKIVQVGYHVPQAARTAVQKILFRGLDAEIENEVVSRRWNKRRWAELYTEGLVGYFRNLRHVYRFLSSFAFHVRHHRQTGSFEVNPIDLIAVEALRVFEPDVYEALPTAKTILTRDTGSTIFGEIKQEIVDEALSQVVSRSTSGNEKKVRAILADLFPAIAPQFAKRTDTARHHDEWLRDLRACHPGLFDRYFTLSIGEQDLSQAELDRIIEAAKDHAAFENAFQSLTERGLQNLTFDRLDAYKEQIPIESMPTLILALCNIGDELPVRAPGMFELDPLSNAWRLVYFGLKREPDQNERLRILRDAISRSRGLALPTEIASMEERSEERESRGHEFLVSPESAAELRALCIQKYRRSLTSRGFISNRRLNVFLWRWSQWGDLEEVRKWIERKTRTPKGALWFLMVALGESHSWGHEHRVRYFINLSTVERFADAKRIRGLVAQLDPARLSLKEQIVLRELDKAFARRAAGKSDDAWHNDFNSPDDEIVE